MKKLCIVVLSILLMLIHQFPVNAMEKNELDYLSLEEILSKEVSKEEVEFIGQAIADEKNKQASLTRTAEEEQWTLTSSTQLYTRRAIKGKYKTRTQSSSSSTHSLTISLSNQFEYEPTSNITISIMGGSSATVTKTLSGPVNERLSNGNVATHRIFLGITFGEIYQYNFKVTDRYTGAFIRNEIVRKVVGAESFGLSQLMRLNTNGSITVGNLDNDAVKTYSSFASYQNALEKYSYSCKNVIYF